MFCALGFNALAFFFRSLLFCCVFGTGFFFEATFLGNQVGIAGPLNVLDQLVSVVNRRFVLPVDIALRFEVRANHRVTFLVRIGFEARQFGCIVCSLINGLLIRDLSDL